MKTPILPVLAALSLSPGSALQAQPTAFTYQGQLNDGGVAANGTFDLQFSLYNVASGGVSIGGPLSATLIVSDGGFTLPLDFGSAPFTGQSLWLQISVRTNGVGSYTNLAPRQPLTSAPYSIYARTADNLDGPLPDGQLSANIPRFDAPGTFGGTMSFSSANSLRTLGNVGIGTLTPIDALLDVEGNIRLNDFDLFLRGGTDRNHGLGWYGAGKGWGSVLPDGPVLYGWSGGALGTTSAGTNVSLFWNNFGNVGIGTITPAVRLDVFDGVGQAGTIHVGGYGANGDPKIIRFGDGDFVHIGEHLADDTLELKATRIFMTANSDSSLNVGIGLSNPATRLHLYAPYDGTTLRIQSSAGFGSAKLEFWSDPFGSLNEWRPGFIQSTDNGGFTGGLGFYVNGSGYDNRQGAVEVMRLVNGNVGIGTSSPSEKLHVNGGFVRVEGYGGEQAYLGGDGFGSDVQIGSFNPGITAVALWNAPNSDYMNLHVKSVTIHGGADLAEPFPMTDESILPGSVVVIDEEHPGRLRISNSSYDTHVAGVVSGAGGINPGIQLKQEGVMEGGQNVALTGRVYALADASDAPIKPGDLLTTSPAPGHCMKASDRERAQGAILGKAMTGLKDGHGKVLVLVTLQ